MQKKIINPPRLPPPRGYNHGLLVNGGRLLFLAGQDASDSNGNIVGPGNLVAQFEQALRNIQQVVEAAGGTMQNVVKLNIFVADRDDYKASLKLLGGIFRTFFGSYYPAMALFQVSGFFQPQALIELEGMAVLEEEP